MFLLLVSFVIPDVPVCEPGRVDNQTDKTNANWNQIVPGKFSQTQRTGDHQWCINLEPSPEEFSVLFQFTSWHFELDSVNLQSDPKTSEFQVSKDFGTAAFIYPFLPFPLNKSRTSECILSRNSRDKSKGVFPLLLFFKKLTDRAMNPIGRSMSELFLDIDLLNSPAAVWLSNYLFWILLSLQEIHTRVSTASYLNVPILWRFQFAFEEENLDNSDLSASTDKAVGNTFWIWLQTNLHVFNCLIQLNDPKIWTSVEYLNFTMKNGSVWLRSC